MPESSNEITFKTRHNGWNWITDIIYNGRKVGFIIAMSLTGIWLGDHFIESTDFRIMTKGKDGLEERGQAKSLEIAKVMTLALQKQKRDIGKYERRS